MEQRSLKITIRILLWISLFFLFTASLFAQGTAVRDTASFNQFNRLINAYETELWKNIDDKNWDEARVDILMLDGLYDNKLMRIARYMRDASNKYAITDEDIQLLVRAKKRLQELRMERDKGENSNGL